MLFWIGTGVVLVTCVDVLGGLNESWIAGREVVELRSGSDAEITDACSPGDQFWRDQVGWQVAERHRCSGKSRVVKVVGDLSGHIIEQRRILCHTP